MRRPVHLRRLGGDDRGAAALEFALLGPIFLLLVFGVLQVGMALQNYNALRNVSADVARYAMVQAQNGNNLNNTQIRTYALTHSQGAPYLLSPARLNAAVTDAATQRVLGARELTLTITYQIDSVMPLLGANGPFISYDRPVFLIDPNYVPEEDDDD